MSSANKEVVIKDTACELGLEERNVMQLLRYVIARTRPLRIENSVPQSAMPITGNESAS